MNHLFYGDNLKIMQQRMAKECVDLIYLDPPFNSKKNYNLMYRTMTGKPVPEQADAFCDTWEMDPEKEELARAMPVLMREYGIDDYYIEFWRLWMKALKDTQPHLLAYLIYMVQRLLHMRVILKPTGSIFLHCDPTASHYIKVMMDAIFHHSNFRNEIIWKRTSAHGSAKRFGPVHDVILFYTKSDRYTWNRVSQPYDDSYIEAFYRHKDQNGRFRLGDLTGAGVRSGESGQQWKGINPTDSGRHWAVPAVPGLSPSEINQMTVQERLDALDQRGLIYWPKKGTIPQFRRYLDPNKGVAVQDVITDINPLSPHADERLGYPTQKPITLLDRIVRASSNEGQVVFDPFCGCGTTIYAAEKNSRQWVGCDIAILSIRLVTDTLKSKYRLVEGIHFDVDGIPESVEEAEALFKRDPHQFQHWIVERVHGFPTQQRTGDRGIDGKLFFDSRDGAPEMVLSVKGGKIRPTDVRDLRGVLEREDNAVMAGFLTLQEPTRAMRDEAARAGMYRHDEHSYPRLQLLTVREILEERREFQSPTIIGRKAKTGQTSFAYD